MKHYKKLIYYVSIFFFFQSINISASEINRDTAFINAAWAGNNKILKALIEDGRVNINAQDDSGSTALKRALFRRHYDIVDLLLDHEEVDPNTTCERYSGKDATIVPLLIDAVNSCEEKIVEKLLKNQKLLINKRASQGDTALFSAIFNGKINIIKMLLTHPNLDPNLFVWGMDHLTFALFCKKDAIAVELLKDARTVINTKSKNAMGDTALHLIAQYSGNNAELLRLFKEKLLQQQ